MALSDSKFPCSPLLGIFPEQESHFLFLPTKSDDLPPPSLFCLCPCPTPLPFSLRFGYPLPFQGWALGGGVATLSASP